MTTPEIDYEALFDVTPSAYLLLSPELAIVEANQAYLELIQRERQQIVGRSLFDVFPGNPSDPSSDGVRNLKASLRRVVNSRRQDVMPLQKYDIATEEPGDFEDRWWYCINTPVLGGSRGVDFIICRVEDVSEFVRSSQIDSRGSADSDQARRGQSRLYARAQELERLNEELRQANARESQVALTLQEAMLHSPDLPRRNIAVRYLPATGTLNVCGDWYDVTDVPRDRFAAAVGDVVGHGLEAAAVMGMLRSALSAAMRATDSPAEALRILGLYADSVEGATSATAVKIMVDTHSRCVTYSSAGHPPPVIRHEDGSCELLDQATDPPLATRSEDEPRVEAVHEYVPGDVLVLYTDGLIERRGEDIDAGLIRLTDALSHHGDLDCEGLADALLFRLGVARGARDDIALVVIRL